MKSQFGLFGCRGIVHLDLEEKHIDSLAGDIAGNLHNLKTVVCMENERKIKFHGGPFRSVSGMNMAISIGVGIIELSKDHGIKIDYDFSFSIFYVVTLCLVTLVTIPLFQAPNLTWVEAGGMAFGIYFFMTMWNVWDYPCSIQTYVQKHCKSLRQGQQD